MKLCPSFFVFDGAVILGNHDQAVNVTGRHGKTGFFVFCSDGPPALSEFIFVLVGAILVSYKIIHRLWVEEASTVLYLPSEVPRVQLRFPNEYPLQLPPFPLLEQS